MFIVSHNRCFQFFYSAIDSPVGEVLAGGHKCIVTQVCGDYKFFKETFKFQAYCNNDCCHLCCASKDDPSRLYTATGPDAPWRQMLRPPSVLDTPLARIPGFSRDLIKVDVMHNLHLGSGLHVFASAILELCEEGLWGAGSINTRLSRAWQEFEQWRKLWKLDCSMSKLTLTTLGVEKKTNYPCLKAKAHNCRILVAWLSEKAVETCHQQLICIFGVGCFLRFPKSLRLLSWFLSVCVLFSSAIANAREEERRYR